MYNHDNEYELEVGYEEYYESEHDSEYECRGSYDEYGDGYADRATLATLRHSMARVKELGHEIKITHALKAEFESRFLEEGAFKLGMFR